MKATWFSQYKSVLWKNILLKRRNIKSTIYEIVLPLYMVTILAIIKLTTQKGALSQFGGFPDYSIFDLAFIGGAQGTGRILVSPDTASARAIMADVKALVLSQTNVTAVEVEYFTNHTVAEAEFLRNNSFVMAGIAFDFNQLANYSYALRFTKDSVVETGYDKLFATQGGCRQEKDGKQENDNGKSKFNCEVNKYLYAGFVQLQNMVDTALMRQHLNNANVPMPSVSVQMLPKPAYLQDSSYLQIISSIYFVMAFAPLVSMLTVLLVVEKEKKIKEGMKMMGLNSSVFWLSWATIYLVLVFVICCLVIIIAVAIKFFSQSNVFLFFIILYFYGLSIISIACLMTPFFNKAQSAGGLASLGTMVVSCLYLVVSLTREYEEGTGSVSYSIPVYGRWLLCLLSPVAVALGIDQAIFLDLRGGMDFTSAREGEFPLYGPIIMLLVDTVLYFALAVYFDLVVPGEYGPRYKPWFLFTSAFWCPPSKENLTESVSYTNKLLAYSTDMGTRRSYVDPAPESEDVEPVPAFMNSKIAVQISNLTKVFKNKADKKSPDIKAVNGLSMTIYEDQITAILGHNGAGKTTLINILTGLTAPTSGKATVLGYDVANASEMSRIRGMTGICPQHNILFNDLTCLEHLHLFAGIKGVTKENMEKEINAALDGVGLKDQADTRSEKLSGGQKRKLSVAIAIIGDPKIIFLDEPTAGMDPYSRRHLWAVLKEKKKGRIIVLTTHFMDEADILADRKAIVNKGSLRCCGSSLFLKNRFGLGYHLNMVVEPNCNTERVSEVVSEIVEGSEVNRIHGKEVDITLPHNSVNKFSQLFSVLEKDSTAKSLGVKNFGVSMTTLEEVFLRLEEDLEGIELTEVEKNSKLKDTSSMASKESRIEMVSSVNPSDTVECLTGTALIMHRVRALCYLRFLLTLRNPLATIFQLVFPVGLLIGGLIVSRNDKSTTNQLATQSPLMMYPTHYANATNGSGQSFPYKTVPRLLVRDTVNSTDSRTMMGSMSQVYYTNSYADSYFSNTSFQLLDTTISPHYLGLQLDNFVANTATKTVDATYKVMYNDTATASIPVSINLMNNFLLKAATGTYGPETLLGVSSLPWPKTASSYQYNNSAFVSILLIAMAFSIIPGVFGVNVVKDRELKVRSQLRVAGVPFSLFWGTQFIVDVVKFFLPVVFMIIAVFAIQVDSLKTGGAVVSFILMALLYIPSNVLFVYFVSFMFTKFETAQSVLPMMISMVGYLPYFPVSLVDMISSEDAAMIIHYILCFIDPPYMIFGALYYIDKVYRKASFVGQENEIAAGDYFSFDSNIPICYICSVLHLFLFFFLLRVLDIKTTGGDVREACRVNSRPNSVIPATNADVTENEDEDVAQERARVRAIQEDARHKEAVAIAENIRKEFKKDGKSSYKNCKKVPQEDTVKVAVRNATFAVEAGEVFGLLGPNGAGKTTTLNMMTAEISPDKGKVVVGGHDIHSSMSEAFQAMGYCPQHDALWENIKLREHLDLYARIRGIPGDKVAEVMEFFLDNLRLEEHKDKNAKKLSGGTKRKVCYCISMMGRPKVVLLDEPSTGMDPQSKRFLWDTIMHGFENTERGAILTTHYMEEADALCSRIAIMVNGRMECIGSTQHLKSKYGSGYMLEIKLKTDEYGELDQAKMEKLHQYVKQQFPQAMVMEQFSERVQYKVPKSNVISLSRTFTVLEEGKEDCDIVEYSFSQSTLEQVFLEFAKTQLEEGQTEEEQETERKKSFHRGTSLEETDTTTKKRVMSTQFSGESVRI